MKRFSHSRQGIRYKRRKQLACSTSTADFMPDRQRQMSGDFGLERCVPGYRAGLAERGRGFAKTLQGGQYKAFELRTEHPQNIHAGERARQLGSSEL
jgi:hypothetical protein